MKRSEVVAAILVTIDSCKMMINPEELTNEGLAEEIMRTIEEIGMLPPMSNLTETTEGGYVRPWTVKWEPEDTK